MAHKTNKQIFHVNKQVFTEARQAMDQIRADPIRDRELQNFVELERKKFQKTDDIDDMINQLK